MRDFIQKYKKEYYEIGFIKCPALGGEKVYFNNHGFNHLIRKRGFSRSFEERKRRLTLIKVIPGVLKNGKIISIKKSTKVKYWAIKYKNYICIVRKIKRGKLLFTVYLMIKIKHLDERDVLSRLAISFSR